MARPEHARNPEMKVVFVEGNIGVGKSSLMRALAARGAVDEIVLEPVELWTEHLRGVYEHDSRRDGTNTWALPMQMLAECTRVESLLAAVWATRARARSQNAEGLKGPIVLVERSSASAALFGEITLSGDERAAFDLVQARYLDILGDTPGLDNCVTVYLRASHETCVRRIHTRARDGEQSLNRDFVCAMHDGHERRFGAPGQVDLVVDCDDMDIDGVADVVATFLNR